MKVGPKSSLRPFLHRALQLYVGIPCASTVPVMALMATDNTVTRKFTYLCQLSPVAWNS